MTGFNLKSFQIAGALALLGFIGLAQAQSPRQAPSPLQNIADNAALTAVQVLAAGGDVQEAAAAAQQTIAVSGAEGEVKAAPGVQTVTVKVSQPSAKTAAVSTARYVPPEQPAQWQWAARQRFVVKTSPVVLGSACLQGCDPVR